MRLVQNGYTIIPLDMWTKKPLLNEWQKHAIRTIEDCERWREILNNNNYGIMTDCCSIIDFDTHGDDKAMRVWEQHKEMFLDGGYIVEKTPGDGIHVTCQKLPIKKNLFDDKSKTYARFIIDDEPLDIEIMCGIGRQVLCYPCWVDPNILKKTKKLTRELTEAYTLNYKGTMSIKEAVSRAVERKIKYIGAPWNEGVQYQRISTATYSNTPTTILRAMPGDFRQAIELYEHRNNKLICGMSLNDVRTPDQELARLSSEDLEVCVEYYVDLYMPYSRQKNHRHDYGRNLSCALYGLGVNDARIERYLHDYARNASRAIDEQEIRGWMEWGRSNHNVPYLPWTKILENRSKNARNHINKLLGGE
jgi:hypothetical protein